MKESKYEIYPMSRSLPSVPIYSQGSGKLSQRKSFELNFLQKQIISEVLPISSENNRSGIGSVEVNIESVFPMTGFAKEAIVLSSSESQEEQSYTLIWRTQSRARVSR